MRWKSHLKLSRRLKYPEDNRAGKWFLHVLGQLQINQTWNHLSHFSCIWKHLVVLQINVSWSVYRPSDLLRSRRLMKHLLYQRELSLPLSDRNPCVELKSLARFHISRWSPEFFFSGSLHNCRNWVHNCEDHSLFAVTFLYIVSVVLRLPNNRYQPFNEHYMQNAHNMFITWR